MTVTKGRILLILKGILIGLFLAAFIVGTALGLNATLLLFAIFVLYLILTLIDMPDNGYEIVGIAIGVLLAILVAALSPAALSGASAALFALALIVLIVG